MNATIISETVINGVGILVEAGRSEGIWYVFFVVLAILGFISILSAIFNKAIEAVTIFIKIFILIPAIIVVGIFNKKKRNDRLSQWGEFQKQLKKSDKRVSKKMWIFWIITRIVLPILIFLFIVFIILT